MIRGLVGKENRPLIPLVVGWNRGVQEIPAMVDTGFSGELKIPSRMIDELGLKITHAQPVLLADGTNMTMRASLAFVTMEGITHEVSALISNGPPVVGGTLLKRFGYKLIVDYKTNIVVLERSD
jgi:clan AA aspartic protease